MSPATGADAAGPVRTVLTRRHSRDTPLHLQRSVITRNFALARELPPTVRTSLLALAIFAALSRVRGRGDVRRLSVAARAASPRPGTQISFRGGPPAELGTVSVTGSRSGRHTGTLQAHSDGQGASFVPAQAFTPGERVTVRTHLHIAGARQGDYGFTVGEPVAPAAEPAHRPPGPWPHVRQPAGPSRPPGLLFTSRSRAAPGFIFLAPKGGSAQDGPMIIDDHGRLVWFHPIAGDDIALDFRAQTYEGRPVLTWWQGQQFVGDGAGVGEIYDQSYRELARVRASGGMRADMHEFTLTPRGTALMTVYQRDKAGDQVVVEKRTGRLTRGELRYCRFRCDSPDDTFTLDYWNISDAIPVA